MKLAYIGTYPPRECGIGVFTNNLFSSMLTSVGINEQVNSGYVVALNSNDDNYEYPEEVKQVIRQEFQEDYMQAVKYINLSGADLCILQHEFGIFGGQSGVYILPLLFKLDVPFIVTLHTVLKKPSYNEKAILQQICKMANKVVVMSHKAIEFLTSIYEVPDNKIVLIEHGVPVIRFNHEIVKKEFKLENRKILLTFGFIGRNKGIETVIKALPRIIKKHPEVLYIVLGKTHPNVLRHSGEEYRIYLTRLTKNLDVEKNVVFLNEFADEQELFRYLYASDIYITPYLNEAQITSGTLSYAVGVGSAVVSTPYWHAAELLTENRGKLFDFGNHDSLAEIIISLLDNPETLHELKIKAQEYGQKITWPKTGEKYLELANSIVQNGVEKSEKENLILDPLILPPFSLNHIIRMTDDTGIIQHAKFGIPSLKEGYCLDDNARALLMVLMAYRQRKDMSALDLLPIYLSYINYMQNPDGTFKNFMSFNRNFLDEVGSEDSFGRTIWALGYLLRTPPNDAYYQAGKSVFFHAATCFEKLNSLRGTANSIIGICHYLKSNPSDDSMIERLRNLAYKLVKSFDENKTTDWKWFESLLAYDNGILPLALLSSSEILNDEKITQTAFLSMDFLEKHTFKENYLSVIGNDKWYKKGGERSFFAQQPIDAMAMVLMYYQAFQITKDNQYLGKLYKSFLWFLGENDLRMSLYDFETQGCCDGFEHYGVNRNQGAESSLAYLISHLTVLQAFQDYYETGEIFNKI